MARETILRFHITNLLGIPCSTHIIIKAIDRKLSNAIWLMNLINTDHIYRQLLDTKNT